MEFIVADRESIEHGILVRTSYIVISIRDPDRHKARIPRQSGLKGVLYLAFHDAEPSPNLKLPDDIVLMSEDQARQVWDVVRKWEGQVGTVVTQCEQGMSRSPAIAAALCRAYGGDWQSFFREYQPNRFVFDTMERARPANAP